MDAVACSIISKAGRHDDVHSLLVKTMIETVMETMVEIMMETVMENDRN